MEIYLIRHTAPAIEKGICYGQADIDVTDSFSKEAEIIQAHLPTAVAAVHSSPLQRCKKLASHLFPRHPIQLHNDLMEINCGDWEMLAWDDIPKEEVNPWMDDYVHVRIKGGESYVDLFERVSLKFSEIITQHHASDEAVVLVAHGGVIRSILSHITSTPLKKSFDEFSLHYGCVIKITGTQDKLQYQVLSNIAHEKEIHKPAYS